MKFSTSLVFAAASASLALAAPKPQAVDGGHGIPPVATISSTNGHEVAASGTTSVTNVHTATEPANPHATTTVSNGHATTTAAAAPSDGQPDIQIPFSDTNGVFTLAPADPAAWAVVAAPDVFNVSAHFSIASQDKASATFSPPQAFAGLQLWGYQRSDGGMLSVSIDGAAVARVDYYNATAGANDGPVLLWENPHLARAQHVVVFANMLDSRVHKAGQFNIDHVVITAAADKPAADPTATTSVSYTAVDPTTSDAPSTTAVAPPVASDAPGSTQSAGQTSQTPPPGAAGALSVPRAGLAAVAFVLGALALF